MAAQVIIDSGHFWKKPALTSQASCVCVRGAHAGRRLWEDAEGRPGVPTGPASVGEGLNQGVPRLTLLAPVPTGHFAMCAFQCGQKHEVFVPGPHVQRDTSDQTALQKAAAHQVRRWLAQSKTNPRGPRGNGRRMAPLPPVPGLAPRTVLANLAVSSVLA